MQCELMKANPNLKNVIPHKFYCQKPETLPHMERQCAAKKQRLQLIKEAELEAENINDLAQCQESTSQCNADAVSQEEMVITVPEPVSEEATQVQIKPLTIEVRVLWQRIN